jgi:hypothetical protein
MANNTTPGVPNRGILPPVNPAERPEALNVNRDGYKPAASPSRNMFNGHIITFSQMQREFKDRNFYVLNNSKEVLGVHFKVAVTIRSEDGTELLVIVPVTWIPVNLSEFASTEDLLRSGALREAIMMKNTMKIVHPDFAEQMLETPVAQAEYRASKLMQRNLSEYGNILAGKEQPRESYKPKEPQLPESVRIAQEVRPEIMSAVHNQDIPSLVSALSLAIYNGDLTAQEKHFVRGKITHQDVVRLLSEDAGQ